MRFLTGLLLSTAIAGISLERLAEKWLAYIALICILLACRQPAGQASPPAEIVPIPLELRGLPLGSSVTLRDGYAYTVMNGDSAVKTMAVYYRKCKNCHNTTVKEKNKVKDTSRHTVKDKSQTGSHNKDRSKQSLKQKPKQAISYGKIEKGPGTTGKVALWCLFLLLLLLLVFLGKRLLK
jgi:hypothetical protein